MCFKTVDDSEDVKEIYSFPGKFNIPDRKLPEFINTPDKWKSQVFNTVNINRWCTLLMKIQSHEHPELNSLEKEQIITAIAEDILSIHGLGRFFPPRFETDS